MKKILFICLMAFSLCSCNNEKERVVYDYVSYLTKGEDFTITEISQYSTITNYEDYKAELEKTVRKCGEDIELYKPMLTSSLYRQKLIPTKLGKENIENIISKIETYVDMQANAKVKLLITNKDNFTPKYTYHCEYKSKGLDNSIWVLLEYDDLENEYKVHALTAGVFNMKP